MEAFEQVGIKEFTKSFGGMVFKSTKVEHHENGRISKIYFEIQPRVINKVLDDDNEQEVQINNENEQSLENVDTDN